MKLSLIKQNLIDTIYPELEKGRPNWDKPHTEAVVYHIEQIVNSHKELKLNINVLIIAAFAHDWGYAGLFNDGKEVDYDNIADKKKLHMEIGARKIKNLLKDSFFEFLLEKEKEEIEHLVLVHDRLAGIESINERILLEADTLGGLDSSFVKPTFDKESNEKYIQEIIVDRVPLFITDYSKGLLPELIKGRKFYLTS